MIGHEAVGPDGESLFFAPFAQQTEVRAVVVVGEEHRLPAVSALSDVVGDSGRHYSCESCHSRPVAWGGNPASI